jgi:hypothetical protein
MYGSHNILAAHGRGGLVPFVLIQKEPKNQDKKKLPRYRPDSQARFFVGPLPAFVLLGKMMQSPDNMPIIVLSDFGRSWSAEVEEIIKKICHFER